MVQSWLSVAGIAIDLGGFVLLLREWWLAFFHESEAAAFEERRARDRSARHHHHTHAPEQLRTHLETSARIQDEMADRGARSRHKSTLSSRKRAFILATGLIVTGSLLQLAGQIPADLFTALTGLD